MITSRAATKGAPSVKKTKATAKRDTIKYKSACTAFSRVMTIAVETIAIAPDI
jgi:hypothetical protein